MGSFRSGPRDAAVLSWARAAHPKEGSPVEKGSDESTSATIWHAAAAPAPAIVVKIRARAAAAREATGRPDVLLRRKRGAGRVPRAAREASLRESRGARARSQTCAGAGAGPNANRRRSKHDPDVRWPAKRSSKNPAARRPSGHPRRPAPLDGIERTAPAFQRRRKIVLVSLAENARAQALPVAALGFAGLDEAETAARQYLTDLKLPPGIGDAILGAQRRVALRYLGRAELPWTNRGDATRMVLR